MNVGSGRTVIPPYIRDLESALDLFIINLSCNFQQPEEIILAIELTEDRLGRIAFGQSEVLFIPNAPFQQIISNTEFTQWNNWQYDDGMKQQLLQTGRLPDGVYQLCVEVRPINDPMPLDEFCYMFDIFLPQNVQLIQPDNGEQVATVFPLFQWTPVNWTAPIRYALKVYQIIEGQAPQDAVAGNQPIFEEEYEGQNNVLYPPSGLPLESGSIYAWQVTALDEFDNPVGENNGMSEVFSFACTGNNGGGVDDWRDSLKLYTSPGFLQGIGLNNDPCPSIQELINSIQSKLMAARSRHQKGARKKAEGEAQSKKGKEAADEAKAKIPDVEKNLANAKQQRDALLDAANKANGASIVAPNAPCSGGALIRAGNGGSLKLDAGTALCIPPGKTDSWLKSFNKIRKDYEYYSKLSTHYSNELAGLKAKQAQGEKDQADGDKKAGEGQAEMDAAAKEIAELEKALEDLKPVAKKCGDIIKDLKAKAAAASDAIKNASQDIVNAGGKALGSKADEHVGGAQDSLKKAEDAYEKGDYAGAQALAAKAVEEAKKSAVAAEREDCYKKASAKVGKAKHDLAVSKNDFPKSNFAAAEAALAKAEAALAEMKQAIADGDYVLAAILCKKVFKIIDEEMYPPMNAIVCNEGDVKEGEHIFITEYQAGHLYMTTQLSPGNVGFEVKQAMALIKDPLGVASMVDNVYGLTSISKAYDIYSVWIKNYGVYDKVCQDGVWINQNLRKTYTKVHLKLEKELEPGESVSKLIMQKNLEKLHSSFLDMAIDDIDEYTLQKL